MADLGPGTMPRGKYPESPAPAGSHALISRTPTPGGMLHANLGLPRPPPRNFQPPLPRFPSRLSPRRMSGTTVGRILSHPLPRRHAWLAGPPANTCSRNKPSKQTATAPPLNLCRSQAGAAQRGLMPFIFGFVGGGARFSEGGCGGGPRFRPAGAGDSGCFPVAAAPRRLECRWGGGEKAKKFAFLCYNAN